MIGDLLVFGRGEGTVQLVGEVVAWWIILSHEGDVERCGEVGQGIKHVDAVLYLSREDEVAHDNAAVGYAVIVGGEGGAFLIVHLAEGGKSHGGIVGGVAVAQCQLRVGIFKIGQIDVDIGGEVAKGFDAVVATGVVDCGREEIASVQFLDDGRDAVSVVGGADKANYVLGGGKNLGDAVDDGLDAFVGRIGSEGGATNVTILAIDALKVAMGEENIADAALAADGRFFAVVNTDSGSLGLGRGVAEAK